MEQPLGDTLDRLGVTADLDDGDLIVSAVVLLAVLPAGERNAVPVIGCSEGMGQIEQAGLVRIAERITSEPPLPDEEEG